MDIPYRARVNERWFLKLPGFHAARTSSQTLDTLIEARGRRPVAPAFTLRCTQAATATGSGRTTTVSATEMISSTGRSAAWACARIASGLDAR
jgi:hypothetical protein